MKKFKKRIQVNGKRRTYHFNSIEDYYRKLDELEKLRRRNFRKGQIIYKTFGTLFLEWKAEKEGSVSEGTIRGYDYAYSLLSKFDTVHFHQITYSDLISIKKGVRSKSKIKQAFRLFEKVYEYSGRVYNYQPYFNPSGLSKTIKLKQHQAVEEGDFHTLSEMKLLMKTLSGKKVKGGSKILNQNLEWLKHIYTIGISTGLRIGEICGLQKSNYKKGDSTILVAGSIKRDRTGSLFYDKKTKNGRSRRIPLTKEATKSLDWFLGRSTNSSAFILYSRNKCRSFPDPQEINSLMKELQELLGVKILSSHGFFRKTFATNIALLSERNFLELATNLQKVMGHSSLAMTLYYIQYTASSIKPELDLFEDSLFNSR